VSISITTKNVSGHFDKDTKSFTILESDCNIIICYCDYIFT